VYDGAPEGCVKDTVGGGGVVMVTVNVELPVFCMPLISVAVTMRVWEPPVEMLNVAVPVTVELRVPGRLALTVTGEPSRVAVKFSMVPLNSEAEKLADTKAGPPQSLPLNASPAAGVVMVTRGTTPIPACAGRVEARVAARQASQRLNDNARAELEVFMQIAFSKT